MNIVSSFTRQGECTQNDGPIRHILTLNCRCSLQKTAIYRKNETRLNPIADGWKRDFSSGKGEKKAKANMSAEFHIGGGVGEGGVGPVKTRPFRGKSPDSSKISMDRSGVGSRCRSVKKPDRHRSPVNLHHLIGIRGSGTTCSSHRPLRRCQSAFVGARTSSQSPALIRYP